MAKSLTADTLVNVVLRVILDGCEDRTVWAIATTQLTLAGRRTEAELLAGRRTVVIYANEDGWLSVRLPCDDLEADERGLTAWRPERN